jgi:transcriptional regulator with XRE-family HTH domain
MTLKELFQSKGYSQYRIAKLLELNESTITRWCNGITYPRVETLSRLAKILGTSETKIIQAIKNSK